MSLNLCHSLSPCSIKANYQFFVNHYIRHFSKNLVRFNFNIPTIFMLISVTILLMISSNAYSLDRYMVKTIYFMPTDSIDKSDWLDLDDIMKSIQMTYKNEMDRHGFPNQTFKLETDNRGDVVVHKVRGDNNKAFYDNVHTFGIVVEELESKGYNDRQSIYAIVISGIGNLNGAAGLAVTYPRGAWYNNSEYYGYCISIEASRQGTENILRHEIGHTFGLSHLLNTSGFIMANGDKLDFHEARWLSKIQYFNHKWTHNLGPEIVRFHGAENQDDGKIRITADIRDTDGLFQSYGFVDTPTRAGFAVVGVNFYDGSINTKVDFDDIDRYVLTASNEIWIQLMDIHGNWRYHHPSSYTLPENKNQDLVDIDLTEGLVAYWDFNENDNNVAKDVSGNGHNGEISGGAKIIKDGKYGSAIKFNGNNSEVSVPYHKDLNPEVFTITAWAKVNSNSTGYRAVVSSRDDFPQRGYIFYCEPQNTWQFWIGAGVNHWKSAQGTAVNLDKWDHLAGTYADGKHKFYVNGKFVDQRNFNISLNTNEEFLIGSGANETPNHHYHFLGMIDEVRVYDRVLTEHEIAAVMDSQSLDLDNLDNEVNQDQNEEQVNPPDQIVCEDCETYVDYDSEHRSVDAKHKLTTQWSEVKFIMR